MCDSQLTLQIVADESLLMLTTLNSRYIIASVFLRSVERVIFIVDATCFNLPKMDDNEDPGDVFAIPDLYGPSNLLLSTQGNPSLLFSELKLTGRFSP